MAGLLSVDENKNSTSVIQSAKNRDLVPCDDFALAVRRPSFVSNFFIFQDFAICTAPVRSIKLADLTHVQVATSRVTFGRFYTTHLAHWHWKWPSGFCDAARGLRELYVTVWQPFQKNIKRDTQRVVGAMSTHYPLGLSTLQCHRCSVQWFYTADSTMITVIVNMCFRLTLSR